MSARPKVARRKRAAAALAAQASWYLHASIPGQAQMPPSAPPRPRRHHSGMDGFEERSAESFPLAVGHFGGLRVWNLLEDGTLQGANSMIWKPGENVATCMHGHLVPCDGQTCAREPDRAERIDITLISSPYPQRLTWNIPGECQCGCGLWAYWNLNDSNLSNHSFARPVIGVVEGYGRAIEGERGFRAAKARIVGLHVAFQIRPAQRYGQRRYFQSGPNIYSFGPQDVGATLGIGPEMHEMPADPEAELRALEANLKIQTDLEERYGVPVYETTPMMLMKHPLGSA